jgi:hypothetical protein
MTAVEYECQTWQELLERVLNSVQQFIAAWNSPSAVAFFRGHPSTAYKLVPGLFRPTSADRWQTESDESNCYYEFRSRAGGLLQGHLSSWDVLFTMQHHGIPTRLLDWTESLGVALHFALEGASGDVDIWMLDPYRLNMHTFKGRTPNTYCTILDVEVDLEHSYADYFVERTDKPEWEQAIAVYPRRNHARLSSQSGVFTLHSGLTPLEETGSSGLTRFTLNLAYSRQMDLGCRR